MEVSEFVFLEPTFNTFNLTHIAASDEARRVLSVPCSHVLVDGNGAANERILAAKQHGAVRLGEELNLAAQIRH